MIDGYITVAAVTPALRVGDVEFNVSEIITKIGECADEGAKIIVFPELAVTGATCGDLFLQDALITAAKDGLGRIARSTRDTDALVFVGLPVRIGRGLYNAAAAINCGEIIGLTVKSYSGRLSGQQDSRWFSYDIGRGGGWNDEDIPVGRRVLYTCDSLEGLTIAAVIGDDEWAPAPVDAKAVAEGATVIAHLAADPALAGHIERRKQDIASQTGRIHTGMIYANAGADESTGDQVFAGHSMIAEDGVILAASDSFEPDVVYSEIDTAMLSHEQMSATPKMRRKNGEDTTVYFTLESEDTVLTRQYPRFPFVPSDEEELKQRCDEIFTIQSYGLVKRLKHTNTKRVILGLSGGLDSTLAILVCAGAFDIMGLPRDQITAVTMPCFGTTGRTYNNACDLATALGADLREIPIADAITQHFEDIGHDENDHDATYENAQARERTQILMDLANQIGALHIGTGDISELALGWATYNGDHMSMYGVNGSVPKTLMRKIVGFIADKAYAESDELADVLYDILDTPVSPELLPPKDGKISQSTEDLVGPYELHDFFLYYTIRYGFGPAKVYRIAKETFDGIYSEDVVLKWIKNFYRRFFSQQFKRSCLADGPQTGTVCIAPRGAWVMPSDASSAVWLRELEAL